MVTSLSPSCSNSPSTSPASSSRSGGSGADARNTDHIVYRIDEFSSLIRAALVCSLIGPPSSCQRLAHVFGGALAAGDAGRNADAVEGRAGQRQPRRQRAPGERHPFPVARRVLRQSTAPPLDP